MHQVHCANGYNLLGVGELPIFLFPFQVALTKVTTRFSGLIPITSKELRTSRNA